MSFRLKPSHFERDGPVCTRSASSFCRNPLNFCTHVMWVKWWYHAKFQPFLSSGCSPFQFQGHLAKNKSLNSWKIANEVRKGWNFSMWLWMLHVRWKKKSWVEISLEKWNVFVTDEFSSETLVLWKRWSSLYTKCIQFLPYSYQLLHTCYVGQMMIPCQVSTFSEFRL